MRLAGRTFFPSLWQKKSRAKKKQRDYPEGVSSFHQLCFQCRLFGFCGSLLLPPPHQSIHICSFVVILLSPVHCRRLPAPLPTFLISAVSLMKGAQSWFLPPFCFSNLSSCPVILSEAGLVLAAVCHDLILGEH